MVISNDYITTFWPDNVPSECTKLVEDEDCLDRNLPESEWCKSCHIYQQLLDEEQNAAEKMEER